MKEMVRSVQNPGRFHVLVRMAWISLYRIGFLIRMNLYFGLECGRLLRSMLVYSFRFS